MTEDTISESLPKKTNEEKIIPKGEEGSSENPVALPGQTIGNTIYRSHYLADSWAAKCYLKFNQFVFTIDRDLETTMIKGSEDESVNKKMAAKVDQVITPMKERREQN